MQLPPSATPPAPPPSSPVGPSLGGRGIHPLRLAGVLVACSTPVTGMLSYAFVAIMVGERHLEGANGLTATGVAVFGLPVVFGVSLIIWSFFKTSVPGRRTLALACVACSAVLLGVGLWSVIAGGRSGDASIGGGLLILASCPLIVAAVLLLCLDARPG